MDRKATQKEAVGA